MTVSYTHLDVYKRQGQWGARGYENIAPGDAIFFDWDLDGSADHVGLVIGRDESRVYTCLLYTSHRATMTLPRCGISLTNGW